MLVVANGGIETHPDFGRTKLNLDHMEPSLALIDTATGALIERHAMPDNLRQLSTRHVDIDADGKIWFACQYEGPRNDLPPLAGSFSRGEDIRFLDLPEETTLALANYVGAIAVNRRDGLVGLTSPKGGAAVTVDAKTGRVVRQESLADAAGIAPVGAWLRRIVLFGRVRRDTEARVAWDQHIVGSASSESHGSDASPAVRSRRRYRPRDRRPVRNSGRRARSCVVSTAFAPSRS